MTKKRKAPLALGMLALLAPAGWAGMSTFWGPSDRVSYRTIRVERGTIATAVSATRTLTPVVTVQVSTQVSGTLAGLEARAENYPNQLSGGQQWVAIARAPVNQPTILLADEATGNLDSQTSAEIMRLLLALNGQQGITVVLVTHEPGIARYPQRVIVFKDGLMVEDGPVMAARQCQRPWPEPSAVVEREEYC